MERAYTFDGTELRIGSTFRFNTHCSDIWEILEFRTVGVTCSNAALISMPAIKARGLNSGRIEIFMPEDWGLRCINKESITHRAEEGR